MALSGRKINNFFELWCQVASKEVWKFEFHQPVFKKVTLADLNSLWQKGYQISVKKLIFDDPFHKNGLVLIIWVLGMIQTSGSVISLMKWGCWGHWGHWGCWGWRGHWGCKGSKAWKITNDDYRVIQVPKFSFILKFWNKYFLLESWNIKLNFGTILSWRLLRPAYVNFLKNGGWNSNVQISWSHWAPKFNKLLIFLSLRAI